VESGAAMQRIKKVGNFHSFVKTKTKLSLFILFFRSLLVNDTELTDKFVD
jgi:hypothetical protein